MRIDDKILGKGKIREEREKRTKLWIEYDDRVRECESYGHQVNNLSGLCRSCYQYVSKSSNENISEERKRDLYNEGFKQFLMENGINVS